MKRILAIALGLLVGACLFAQEQDLDLQYGAELLKPGTPAPAFTLEDINGNTVSLSQFKGRKVVLVFWATWCPDCRAEVPDLKAMHAASDAGEVVYVSISFDRSKDAWEKYVKENGMGWVQLFDASGKKDSKIGEAYHVKWIPSMYLIGADGKVELGTVVLEKIAKKLNIKLSK